MEERGGAGGGRRRLSLLEQMSAVDHSRDLAGLTLEAVIGSQKQPTNAVGHTPAQVNRTLLDIIRDDQPHGSLFGHKDKKTWKAFREKLRLKRAGAAWTSSVPIPASDVPIQNFSNPSRSLMSRRGSVRFTTVSDDSTQDQPAVSSFKPQMSRRISSRYGLSNNEESDSSRSDDSSLNTHAVGDEPPARSFRPQMSRHCSSRRTGNPTEEESTPAVGGRKLSVALAEERSLSAREAVAAQEAAEAEAAAEAQQESPEETSFTAIGGGAEAEPVRMSLMDLLEETDRQMGVVGSSYTKADDVECGDEEDDGFNGGDGIEHTCCVCMIRHKGAAFIPCGHTFCRMCSRELWVERGTCPLCNGYILEILDIF